MKKSARFSLVMLAIFLGLIGNAAFAQSDKDAVRALKKLQTKCSVGMSYRDFGNALGDTQFEVDLFLESKAAQNKLSTAEHVKLAMKYYKQALAIWDIKITVGKRFYPAGISTVKNLLRLYPETADAIIRERSLELYDFDQAVSIMLAKASDEVKSAMESLNTDEESVN